MTPPGGGAHASGRAAAAPQDLAVDTQAPLAMQVDEVASWLDSLLAGGRTA